MEMNKSNAITREEAIEMVNTAFEMWENEYDTGDDWSKEHEARDMAINALEQQRVGHWEKMVEVYDLQQNRMLVPYGYDDAKFGNTPIYVCDCGCESNKNSRFCPDCGAEMLDDR